LDANLKPSIPELESILTTRCDPIPPVLVAPDLSPRVLDYCRQKRLAAVDLSGRVYNPNGVATAESAFLTVWARLGSWHGDLVLVGGLVPK
jgi:hypothetical protein